MIAQPETLPEPEAAEWASLRALDVARVSGPVAEILASHPRIQAVFGLDCGSFSSLLVDAPDVPLRHVELRPGHLQIPIGAFDREATLPRLVRLALAMDIGPLFLPWLLTSALGKRLTHLGVGFERKHLAEIPLLLKDYGPNLQHVALLRADGSQTVALNMFTSARRPAAYVPWCRVVRHGSEFRVTELGRGTSHRLQSSTWHPRRRRTYRRPMCHEHLTRRARARSSSRGAFPPRARASPRWSHRLSGRSSTARDAQPVGRWARNSSRQSFRISCRVSPTRSSHSAIGSASWSRRPTHSNFEWPNTSRPGSGRTTASSTSLTG